MDDCYDFSILLNFVIWYIRPLHDLLLFVSSRKPTAHLISDKVNDIAVHLKQNLSFNIMPAILDELTDDYNACERDACVKELKKLQLTNSFACVNPVFCMCF